MKKTIVMLALMLSMPAAVEAAEKHRLKLGVMAGVSFPQLNSELGTTFSVNLELGYFLPVWGGRLGLVTALGYSQPGASGTGSDPRLPDETYSWDITQRILAWTIAAAVNVLPSESSWNLAFLLGPRVVFLEQLSSGEGGGEPFGEHAERATRPGLLLATAFQYRLGPGALFGQLGLPMTFEDLRTSGDLTVLQLEVLLGYRLSFGF